MLAIFSDGQIACPVYSSAFAFEIPKNKDKKSMPKIAYNDFLFFISFICSTRSSMVVCAITSICCPTVVMGMIRFRLQIPMLELL